MSENPNEIKEETDSKSENPKARFHFVQTPETQKILGEIETVKDSLDRNENMAPEQLIALSRDLEGLTLDVEGDLLTLEEVKAIPDLQENIKTWREIRRGRTVEYNLMTYLPAQIAEILSKQKNVQTLEFRYLKNLTPDAARNLANFEGRRIIFDDLDFISDEVAQIIATFKVYDLGIWSPQLRDTTLGFLAKKKGLLRLGIQDLPITTAKLLSKQEGSLYLGSLEAITDEAAEEFAKHAGDLSLPKLKKMSTGMAKSFSRHKDALDISGLESLTDEAAQILSTSGGTLILSNGTKMSEKAKQMLRDRGELTHFYISDEF